MKMLLLVLGLSLLFLPSFSKADDRFVDHGDGTVTDLRLKVMWSRSDNQGDVDWKNAQRWVRYTFPYSLPPEKRKGWRLPTIDELQTLFVRDKSYRGYETDCGQRVLMVPEIQLSCGWVWSSEKRSITARVYNFQRGYHYTDRMVHKKAYRALAVRDLK
jgi:hypothetical protein